MLTLSGMRTPCKCDRPNLEKSMRAVNHSKRGKTPGLSGIYAEMLRAGGTAAILWLHALFSIWNTGIIPTETGRCRSVWKGKGDTQGCNNYRGYPALCARQGRGTDSPG